MSRIEQIARIHYEGLVEEFKSVGLDANITYKHLKERWEEYDGFVRTFSEDGKVVGFITNDSEDSMIYIDPDYQRQGIGSRLINSTYIPTVWVINGNEKAESFYKKNGYKPTLSRTVKKFGHEIDETKWGKKCLVRIRRKNEKRNEAD